MKTVFSSNKIAHVWLAQTQSEGKARANMFFRDRVIYSYGYHFPIAEILDAPNGEQVVLLTTQRRSMSTSRHISYVRQALRSSPLHVVYCNTPGGAHIFNIAAFKREYDAAMAKHNKARKPELYAPEVKTQARRAREYCEVMCLPVPPWAMIPDGVEAGGPLTLAAMVHQPQKEMRI